jgi:hypothetical protein
MPAFRSGVVVDLLSERPGLQRVVVDLAGAHERAYVLTLVTGDVAIGDRVVVNTTAVELGLGTGGWHVVHWNLERGEWRSPQTGHVMKMRYTSLQIDVEPADCDGDDLKGTPVVVAGLHSQLAGVAVAFKQAAPSSRLAYVMTDGGALPLALSDLVHDLGTRGLLDATVTSGHAFGGDYEAVTVASALIVARERAGADAVVVAMGPGGVGTGTTLGFTALEGADTLATVVELGGIAIAALRASDADARERHRGISHHSLRTLRATRAPVVVAVPEGLEIEDTHEIVLVRPVGIVAEFDRLGLTVESMGRPAADDPLLFECAAVAGLVAARHVT